MFHRWKWGMESATFIRCTAGQLSSCHLYYRRRPSRNFPSSSPFTERFHGWNCNAVYRLFPKESLGYTRNYIRSSYLRFKSRFISPCSSTRNNGRYNEGWGVVRIIRLPTICNASVEVQTVVLKLIRRGDSEQ